jgi:hypothetical protein
MSFLSDAWNAVTGLFGDHTPAAPDPAQQQAAEALKRQAELDDAKQALAGKFQLADDAAGGAHAPNQVNAKQLEEITGLYADIKNGHSDIVFDTQGMSPEDAAKFKSGAMGDMATMLQTESGRLMLQSLAHGANDKYHPDERRKAGAPADGTDGHPLVHIGRSDAEHHPECSFQQVSRDVYMDHPEMASADKNGLGASPDVTYRPGETWKAPDGFEFRSDINLFHEMAHAYHTKMGDDAKGALPDDVAHDGGQKTDEAQAVGLYGLGAGKLTENSYRAERRALGEVAPNRDYYKREGMVE